MFKAKSCEEAQHFSLPEVCVAELSRVHSASASVQKQPLKENHMVAVGRGRNLDCSLCAVRNQVVGLTEECFVRDLDVAVVTILLPLLMPQTVIMFSLWSRRPKQTVGE